MSPLMSLLLSMACESNHIKSYGWALLSRAHSGLKLALVYVWSLCHPRWAHYITSGLQANYSVYDFLRDSWFHWRNFTRHFIIVLLLTTASTDSPAASVDSETITLNSGTLQTFEILPVSNTWDTSYWLCLCKRKMSYLDGIRIQRPTGQTEHQLDIHFDVIVMLFLCMYINQFFFPSENDKWYRFVLTQYKSNWLLPKISGHLLHELLVMFEYVE